MIKKLENPNVFPILGEYVHQSGMMLRDYFAASAMNGLMSDFTETGLTIKKTFGKDQSHDSGVAKIAYIIADSMLKARME